MLNKIKNRKQEGFTIIEVLIVLAIAGLILLIVFLAVPALQRNSRNTQRRNDVAGILGATNEYVTSNQGNLPADDTAFTNGVDPLAKDGFYADGDTTYIASVPGPAPTTIAIDKVEVYGKAKCNGNAILAGTTRQYAAIYSVEGSNGAAVFQCQEG